MFYTLCHVTEELTAFRVEADIMEGLRRVKDRDGVPLSFWRRLFMVSLLPLPVYARAFREKALNLLFTAVDPLVASS